MKFYLKNLFNEIDLRDKNILDIGAGAGAYTSYMALNGAKKVIGLEPEIEGSRSNYISKFNELKEGLNLDNVFLKPLTFQSFENNEEKFDVILLHHSINHLDEDACINLNNSNEAKNTYEKIFNKLYEMSSNDADIIVADCSNKNFFSFLGVKNIFSPTIEWHKHQAPEKWTEIMEKVGYKIIKIEWVVPFRTIGKIFLGNKYCSYFIHSHFVIYAKKQ
ncbi:MAG: hypothetical protein A2271_03130 [Candidatus Moranbacteria bacterium RIFOXYA12_FULL_35_19]|nr:MAG: hypothetical protein A2489_03135 [Candidatus Moranbacteria bacterium RIFOXYC12_FULL_36_13]OGI36567.1 MAG: hypothetical protein A2271_03130 [Candidatus Moranbacteria bacterium RIFOXYA12_FULL_35_19]